MNVLSLFDGISCGQVALERAEIKVNKYYASEVSKDSIYITQKNFPNTIQLGDVKDLSQDKLLELDKIDLLIGGSPCQNLSIAVINNDKYNQGLQGEKSKLFYEYIRILRIVKPKYFLFENVASMPSKDKDIISLSLGATPIRLNSNIVSAQDRDRYYWTNIPNIVIPADREIVLKNILEDSVDEKYYYKQSYDFHGFDKKIIATLHVNGHDILKRVYNPEFKCGTLTACRGGYKQKKVYINGRVRKLTPLEYERLQTLPDNYTYGISDSSRYNALGDGWTVDIIRCLLEPLVVCKTEHDKIS